MDNTQKVNSFADIVNSTGGKDVLKEFLAKKMKIQEHVKARCEWFSKKPLDWRLNFINKVRLFYNSDKYKDRWVKRGIEPPTDLFWFLYEYALRYGKPVNGIIERHPKHFRFTSYLGLTPEGYYVERLDGQGSVINVLTYNEMSEYLEQNID